MTDTFRSMFDDPAGRIAFTASGEGAPILLLHGWPQTGHAWRHVLPRLAGDHRVIVPDLPGFGRSAKLDTGYDKRTLADRLAAMMAALGHKRYLVVGHDMGGQVAYPLAALHREAVSGLVFIESALPGLGQEGAMDVWAGGSWHFAFNMTPHLAETLVAGHEEAFLDIVLLRERIGVRSDAAITDKDIAIYARALRRPGAIRAASSYYRALRQDAVDNAELSHTPLDCPVLAISAAQGYAGGAEAVMRKVASEVEPLVIDESGHYLPEEQPKALAAAISRFAARLT